MGQAFPDHLHPLLGILVTAFCSACSFIERVIEQLNVGQHQLQFNRFHVVNGINLSSNVDHIGIFKATHDLQNGINLTNMGEKLVAQPLPLTGALYDPSNIEQLKSSWHNLFRDDVLRDPAQSGVWHADNSFVGLDCTKWIIRALGSL